MISYYYNDKKFINVILVLLYNFNNSGHFWYNTVEVLILKIIFYILLY